MRESCLVYCYFGIQSLFEVVLLYTFYTSMQYVGWPELGGEGEGERILLSGDHMVFRRIGRGISRRQQSTKGSYEKINCQLTFSEDGIISKILLRRN